MPAQPHNFDSTYFRAALGRFATGVTVITCESAHPATPVGLTISSFNSVSLDPPMVLWSLTRKASSLAHFQRAERYVIHVLAASQLHLARQFASGPQSLRFRDLRLKRAPGGTLMLDDPECAAWFECYNLTRHEAGDHLVFIGQVERCGRSFNQPLVYHAGDFDLTPSTEPLSNN
ncbi:flavin reductase [Allopusillimonas soli]|uniref:Flavin reductase family protein n=1 Tax=Allopusillimonas soli TaxID=659016 RepID=A0A853F6T6_9BURK|nr:flavin reductase family protein [Allopusillimonas soli]NYT35679.1 flavin reductase family protein [Allopusillimonas soli]TEA76071.1 flavin reductase [Allopusillimonas soli]